MKTRDVLLAAVILCGLVLATKAAQVSVTPEFWAWIATAVPALAQSAGVRVLVAAFALLSFASFLASGFEARSRSRRRREAEQARARAIREEQIRKSLTYQFNKPTDRGPRAA